MNNKFEEFIGKKIGKSTIISIDPNRPHNKTYFICKCDCGTTRKVNASKLIRGITKSCYKCKNVGELNRNFRGYGLILGTYMSEIRSSCNRRSGEKKLIDIDSKYLHELFIEQNGKCALSGVDIKLSLDSYSFKSSTASPDRINSNKGYIKGNVQWVHKDINCLKSNFSEEKFIELCKQVYFYQKEKGNLK